VRHKQGYGYKNSKIHRIVPNFVIQGGDITKGDGTGGRSIYEKTKLADLWGNFKDEQPFLEHDKPGIVSMANSGPNINRSASPQHAVDSKSHLTCYTDRSQFFITLKAKPKLNGKHVAFGHVVAGFEIVQLISTKVIGENVIVISDCGVML
jgi:cyclophilin family peptidyl-prolyl cis-trans isomerase